MITHLDDPALDTLCQELALLSSVSAATGSWPTDQLALCGDAGVHAWFLPAPVGGLGWPASDVARGYMRLGRACLNTAFVLTQRVGACRRIAATTNTALAARLLPPLLSGDTFATLGISHLTTSRRHLGRPVLAAEPTETGYRLNGFSPWVTGGAHADHIVTGAELPDGRQILIALPTALDGVHPAPATQLVALSASHTAAVHCDNVAIDTEAHILAGPQKNIMGGGLGARTGGLQTTSLALGLTLAALDLLDAEASRRPQLQPSADALHAECDALTDQLTSIADDPGAGDPHALRAQANGLVNRAAQAALIATKGTGYLELAPAGRYCRQALFFLVWSCPLEVQIASMESLATVRR